MEFGELIASQQGSETGMLSGNQNHDGIEKITYKYNNSMQK